MSAAWESRVQHVGLVLPFSSRHAHPEYNEYNESLQTSRIQRLLLFI